MHLCICVFVYLCICVYVYVYALDKWLLLLVCLHGAIYTYTGIPLRGHTSARGAFITRKLSQNQAEYRRKGEKEERRKELEKGGDTIERIEEMKGKIIGGKELTLVCPCRCNYAFN